MPNLEHSVAVSKYHPGKENNPIKLTFPGEMRGEGRSGASGMGDGQR